MRIEPTSNKKEETRKIKSKKSRLKKKGKDISKVEEGSSVPSLKELILEKIDERADVLLQEVIEMGNEFARSPTYRHLKEYEERVKRFITYIVEKEFKVREELKKTRGRTRVDLCIIVDEVNAQLKDLADRMMKGERDTLVYAAKVDEIRGLLMDLYR